MKAADDIGATAFIPNPGSIPAMEGILPYMTEDMHPFHRMQYRFAYQQCADPDCVVSLDRGEQGHLVCPEEQFRGRTIGAPSSATPKGANKAGSGGADNAQSHNRGMDGPWGTNYHRGWTGRNYHVTGGHEAEAESAEEAKKPSRLGLWVLRKLGYKGPGPAPLRKAPHHGAPQHPHPHHDG